MKTKMGDFKRLPFNLKMVKKSVVDAVPEEMGTYSSLSPSESSFKSVFIWMIDEEELLLLWSRNRASLACASNSIQTTLFLDNLILSSSLISIHISISQLRRAG